MVVTPDLLKSFPLLNRVPVAALESLASQSSLQSVARRGIVLSAGIQEEHLCFLFEGRLQGVDFTIDGREVGLYFVEPGEYCGEIGLFDRGAQPEFVIALTSARVAMVPMDAFRAIMNKTPDIVTALGMKLAARVRQMTYQRSLLGLPNIPQRVCCQLWALIPLTDKEQPSSAISNPPTHMEIAIMLNVSRETVTRVFQTLQNRQIVKRNGSASLRVINLVSLKDLAEGKEEL
ncbi:MAG: Crp/Fnr family transcriptional regulator [Gammaproteobacteria bacterium]|nr:Crp/Fnr family transcriptional regulator [Gammaproteobacteria bacterium]